MKIILLLMVVLVFMVTPFSSANAHHDYRNSRSSSISIGINGGSGSFYYSQQKYSRPIRANSYTREVYYGGYYSRIKNHIHRQEGRRYINDFSYIPVVVVPATNRYHRHYRGCRCGY